MEQASSARQTICLRPQLPDDIERVRAFNGRLVASGKPVPFLLAESVGGETTNPKQPWVLLAGDTVRGGVLLTQHRALVGGTEQRVVNIQAPITEGVTDPRFASLSVGLFREIQRQFGEAYAVGMGEIDRPLPRVLKALRWQVELAPFRFVPLQVGKVIRSIGAIRSRIPSALQPLAVAGGTLVSPLYRQLLKYRTNSALEVIVSEDDSVNAVADGWSSMAGSIGFSLVRDARESAALFSASQGETVLRSRGDRGSVAVIRTRRLEAPSAFSGLTVVTVLELLASDEERLATLSRQLLAYLARQPVDLVVTNISAVNHIVALDRSGWVRGPSNYVVALSPGLIAAGANVSTSYVTRTDGDGRLNL
jgi:hypothetical protein